MPTNATANQDTCNPDFTIVCNYRLPDRNEEDPLEPKDIPFNQCDELIVEEAYLSSSGDVAYTTDAQALQRLAELVGTQSQ